MQFYKITRVKIYDIIVIYNRDDKAESDFIRPSIIYRFVINGCKQDSVMASSGGECDWAANNK